MRWTESLKECNRIQIVRQTHPREGGIECTNEEYILTLRQTRKLQMMHIHRKRFVNANGILSVYLPSCADVFLPFSQFLWMTSWSFADFRKIHKCSLDVKVLYKHAHEKRKADCWSLNRWQFVNSSSEIPTSAHLSGFTCSREKGKSLEKVWNFIMVLKLLEFWVFGLDKLLFGLEIWSVILCKVVIMFSMLPCSVKV